MSTTLSLLNQYSICSSNDDIKSHGTASMIGIINLYHIYIGYQHSDYKVPYNESKLTSTSRIVETFASEFSGSSYANILTSYDGTSQFSFKGNTFYNIPFDVGTLTDSTIENYVISAVQHQWSKFDPKGIYIVIFRGDLSYSSTYVSGQSWSSDWCGFHKTLTTPQNPSSLIPIVIIGDTGFLKPSMPKTCMVQYIDASNVKYVSEYHISAFQSPNKNPTADALVNIYAHEIMDTVTNPYGASGWYRKCDGAEIADLCAWKFDYIYQSIDGTHYNTQLGNNKFILQSIWNNNPNPMKLGCVVNSSKIPLVYSSNNSIEDISKMSYTIQAAIVVSVVMGCFCFVIIYYYCFLRKTKPTKKESFLLKLNLRPEEDQFTNGIFHSHDSTLYSSQSSRSLV